MLMVAVAGAECGRVGRRLPHQAAGSRCYALPFAREPGGTAFFQLPRQPGGGAAWAGAAPRGSAQPYPAQPLPDDC